MINLREYQESGVENIKDALRKNTKAILFQLPTGGGKTVIFSYIALSASQKDKRVLILTDRDELLKQAGGSLKKFGVNCAYIKAGSKFIDYRKNLYVAMSQTLRNRILIPEWRDFIKNDIDLIIIDEAHIQEFNYLFESGILKGKNVLGFTATPKRTGKMRQLGLDYEKLIRGAEPRDLIDLGHLLNCDMYEFQAPDLTGVSTNTTSGDFNETQMFQKFDRPTLYAGLLQNYEKHTPGQKMLVFCCNVEHAIKTTIELNEAGYNARFICSEKGEPKAVNQNSLFEGDSNRAEIEKYNEKYREYLFFKENFRKYSGTRKQIFDGFANNEFEILVNVDIATKGYDCPDIRVVAVYRATNSTTLWLQMIGRGSRTSEETGKTHFTVFDFGGNKERLGGYDQNRDWSLWHDTRNNSGGVPPLKECGINSKGKAITSGNSVEKGCKRLIMASINICPFCGFKYPDKKDSAEVELTLEEIKDDQGVSLAVKSFADMSWDELEIYRKAKKHKNAWLWRQLWIRGGETELQGFAEAKHWGNNITNQAINFCKNIF